MSPATQATATDEPGTASGNAGDDLTATSKLLEVTDPSLEISGAHVRIIAPETEDNYLTSEAGPRVGVGAAGGRWDR